MDPTGQRSASGSRLAAIVLFAAGITLVGCPDSGQTKTDRGAADEGGTVDLGSGGRDAALTGDRAVALGERGGLAADGASAPPDKGGGGTHQLTNLFFLHHSVGYGLVFEGDMRGLIAKYNTTHGQTFALWDHSYNSEGLFDAAGNNLSAYDIPDDNTDPDGLRDLWTSPAAACASARNKILANHQVIAFKSCFTAAAISDLQTLNEYKSAYLSMRTFFDTRKDRLFVVIPMPPLHRLETTTAEANNARAFASWLCSPAYLSGHDNVVCFDLFDELAQADDGSAAANRLRWEYEDNHAEPESHPSAAANAKVAPIFAQFLIDAALSY